MFLHSIHHNRNNLHWKYLPSNYSLTQIYSKSRDKIHLGVFLSWTSVTDGQQWKLFGSFFWIKFPSIIPHCFINIDHDYLFEADHIEYRVTQLILNATRIQWAKNWEDWLKNGTKNNSCWTIWQLNNKENQKNIFV